ncbi:hypothetical protein ACQEV2_43165 [Streptomyces sp. CA-251387]|uniref:hypothetical protein n=1 Tax=Streptomyces sp. CA-251387 TaxID=3240064 RepID=UPI003D8A83A2
MRPRRALPHRQNATGAEELSPDYQALMAAAVEASEDELMAAAVEASEDELGARRAAVVLGWDSASASRVEGARAPMSMVIDHRTTASLVSVRRS